MFCSIKATSEKIYDEMHIARFLSTLHKFFQPHVTATWDLTLENLEARLIINEMRYCAVTEINSEAFKTEVVK